jgi:hypothetical protein
MDQRPACPDELRRDGEAAFSRRDYPTAWQCFADCLSALIASEGARSGAVATILFKLGEVARRQAWRAQVRVDELRDGMALARELHDRALNLRRLIRGKHHPEIAESLDALGELTQDEVFLGLGGDRDARLARDLQAEALAIWRDALGASHPHVAERCCALANVYRGLREFGGARMLLQEALLIARLPTSGHDVLRRVQFCLMLLERSMTPAPGPRRLH